ncbi:MAG: FtsX-like permease family protein, partial [Gemmatimonadota bacterium]
MKLAWEIARRYLAPRRGGRFLSFITWISLGGVTVGVTALVVVIAVMTGAQEDFQEKILETSPHILLMKHSESLRMGEWRAVLDSVRAVEGVVSATPFLLTKVALLRGEYAQSADLYGLLVDEMGDAATGIEERISAGSLTLEGTESGFPPLLVGNRLADRMLVFPGDTLLVIAYENIQRDPMGGIFPVMRQFEVTGTFSTGLYDYDLANLYARMEDVQDLLSIRDSDQVSGLGIRTTDPWTANALADSLGALLGFPYYAQSWTETNNALFSALKLEKLAMAVILFLIVVVAAFNIVSTLVMVVVDRTREIGILKSMGLTNRGVLHVFVLQGLWIGFIGATVGTLLGTGVCWLLDTYEIIRIPPDVYFVDRLPVALKAVDVILIYLATVAVAFAATIYPALQAAALEPVEAIRHE